MPILKRANANYTNRLDKSYYENNDDVKLTR